MLGVASRGAACDSGSRWNPPCLSLRAVGSCPGMGLGADGSGASRWFSRGSPHQVRGDEWKPGVKTRGRCRQGARGQCPKRCQRFFLGWNFVVVFSLPPRRSQKSGESQQSCPSVHPRPGRALPAGAFPPNGVFAAVRTPLAKWRRAVLPKIVFFFFLKKVNAW